MTSQPTRRQLLQGSLAAGLTVAASTALGPAPASAAPPTGHTVGAVGVSGVKSGEDAQVARAGVAAVA